MQGTENEQLGRPLDRIFSTGIFLTVIKDNLNMV